MICADDANPDAVSLAKDVSGNFVVQKLFDIGDTCVVVFSMWMLLCRIDTQTLSPFKLESRKHPDRNAGTEEEAGRKAAA